MPKNRKQANAIKIYDTNIYHPIVRPSLIIDCDGENVLMVSINYSMVNKTETFMVADGANCILLLRNRTIGNTPIFFAEYEIYHGDKESIENDPILMTQGNSFMESVTYFQKIEECFLAKLGEHIDRRTVYTASEPANKAIRWLMKDSKYSSCERSDFLERFALTAVNFAAPVESEANDQGLWITAGRHCIWQAVGCTGSVVTELNYRALSGNFSGSIASEIGILRNLTAIDLGELHLRRQDVASDRKKDMTMFSPPLVYSQNHSRFVESFGNLTNRNRPSDFLD